MMQPLILVLVGAAAGLGFTTLVRALSRDPGPRYAVALLVTALLYVLFAGVGRSGSGVALETVGLIVFGGLAVAGWRRRAPLVVAFGWLAHPLWDVALHTVGSGAAYTPSGYVEACIGFDLVVAAVIVRTAAVSARSAVATPTVGAP